MKGKYDDMLNLPHPVSKRHLPMNKGDRAAQFAPFAALTGYEAELEESSRTTEQKLELDEQEMQSIARKLLRIKECINDHPLLSITYFVPDKLKAGGKYVNENVTIRRIDEYAGQIITQGGRIALGDIIAIEGDIFEQGY